MKLTTAGENYLRDQLMTYGSQSVVANLEDPKCWNLWVQDAIWARLEKSPDEDVSFELGSFSTKDKNPHTIDFYDEHFFCGSLMRYVDGSYIRDATFAERYESDAAAENDGGVGAFQTEINGEKVTVYVEA